jgi:hypothetical protein
MGQPDRTGARSPASVRRAKGSRSSTNEIAFGRAAYLWAGLHGRVALGDAIPTFPWPTEDKYIEWTLEIHITAQAGRQLR